MKDRKRIPRQKRAIETKMHIVETAIGLFSEKGYYNTSSNEISRRAGVAIGSFYSYFHDKKQLFLEALDYYDRRIREGMETDLSVEAAGREKTVQAFINNTIQAHKIFPGFHLEVEAMRILEPDISAAFHEKETREIRHLRELLEMWKHEVQVKDLETASIILYHIVEKTVHIVLFSKPEEVEEKKLIRELSAMILRYLFSAGPPNHAG